MELISAQKEHDQVEYSFRKREAIWGRRRLWDFGILHKALIFLQFFFFPLKLTQNEGGWEFIFYNLSFYYSLRGIIFRSNFFDLLEVNVLPSL